MAIRYYDGKNGVDANAGTSFALRKKFPTTVNSIPAGEEIRFMETPLTAMTINGSFTNLSRTVTLSSAVNATIDDCGTAWTPSTNVTQSQNTTVMKEGAACQNIIIASGFTTGLVAYRATGLLDLSGYQQITFWVQVNTSSVAAGAYEIRLCSDTAGVTSVNTFALPALAATSIWAAITINLSVNLGSAIQSIALYRTTNPGAQTLILDNFCAVKASSSDDALSLNSLIGKSTAISARDGVYCIKSISGTTVILDQNTAAISTVGRGYYGTTETVPLYKIEPVLTIMNDSNTFSSSISTGTEASPIIFTGGWNTTDMSTQTGMTYFSGQNSRGNLFFLSSSVWLIFSKLGAARYNSALSPSNTTMLLVSDMEIISSTGSAFNGLGYGTRLNNIFSHNCGSAGFNFTTVNSGTELKSYNNTSTGVTFSSGAGSIITNLTCNNNGSGGLNFNTDSNIVRNYRSDANASYGCQVFAGSNYIYDAVMTDSVPFSPVGIQNNYKLFSHNDQGIVGAHKTYASGYTSGTEATIRRTASGFAWFIAPSDILRNSQYPATMKLCSIYCVANKTVTVNAYPYRTNTGLTLKLACRGRQIAGVDNDIFSSVAAGAAGSYEASPISISFTPTQSGVVEIEGWAWGGTTYIGYFDDMTFTSV